jgi:hypothetical protein
MSDPIEVSPEADETATSAATGPRGGPDRPRAGWGRTALAGVVALAVLAAPLVIAKAVIGDSDDPTTDETAGSLIAHRSTTESAQADATQRNSLQTRQTTTTTTAEPKPTTTTTAKPRPKPKPVVTTPPTTAAPKPKPKPQPKPVVTTPPATVASAPALPGNGRLGDPNLDASWDHLAQCESGGNWAINTGNGFYGGIQFTQQSWNGVGGTGRPDHASRATQIAMGKRLWKIQGWAAWPGCTHKFGWR